MNKRIPAIAAWLLALPLMLFGANKLLGFLQVAPPSGKEAQLFLGAMFSTYLVKFVAFTEITGGLLLLFKRTRFWGLLIVAPVIVNVALFHTAHDFIGNGIWLFSLSTFVWVCYHQRNQLYSLIQIQE